MFLLFFFSSRRRHTRLQGDWSSDVCSSHLLDGIYVSSLIEGGEIIERMGDRILGRVALDDVIDPVTSETITQGNTEITRSEERRVGKERRSRGPQKG